MPNRAYKNNKTGNPIEANNVDIKNRNPTFICCTETVMLQ